MTAELDVGSILRGIDASLSSSRKLLDEYKEKYMNDDTVTTVKSKKLIQVYGDAVSDFGVLSSMMVEVSEAIMDIRAIKRNLRINPLPVTVDKRVRESLDYYTDMLSNLRDAIVSLRESLNAKMRFYNSCQYQQIDKIYGDKC